MADRIAGPAGVIQQHNAFLSRSQPAAQAFMALEQAEQDAIIGFLDSLGRAEFDHNGDNEIDEQDLATILSCFTGPTPTYVPDDPCSISDADQDGDVDPDDFDLFLTVYTGPQGDCNENSVADPLDLLNGTSTDCNANGLPDECDPESTDVALFVSLLLQDDPNAILVCMADRTGDGFLNALDIQPFVDDLLN